MKLKKHNINTNELAISQYINMVTNNLNISEMDLMIKFKA